MPQIILTPARTGVFCECFTHQAATVFRLAEVIVSNKRQSKVEEADK